MTETGLPVRYYIPREDVNWDLLVPSDTKTECPYKGHAVYWSVKVGDKVHSDFIWAYPEPLADALRVKGAVGFYHEKMTVTVDGEIQDSPPVFFAR